jgi:putative oxidoreductase
MLMTHGIPKFMKMVGGDFSFGNPIGIGAVPSLVLTVIAEVLCPVLIIFGIKTRLATIPPIVVMLVALFVVHWSDPIGAKEKAILFLVGFIAIGLMGPGKLSVDKR